MDAIGLCPSSTGQPGGQRTGQRMSHYIVSEGPFDQTCTNLLTRGFTLSWHDRAREDAGGAEPTNTRAKYTCSGCGLKAWAKPNAVLICGACDTVLADAA